MRSFNTAGLTGSKNSVTTEFEPTPSSADDGEIKGTVERARETHLFFFGHRDCKARDIVSCVLGASPKSAMCSGSHLRFASRLRATWGAHTCTTSATVKSSMSCKNSCVDKPGTADEDVEGAMGEEDRGSEGTGTLVVPGTSRGLHLFGGATTGVSGFSRGALEIGKRQGMHPIHWEYRVVKLQRGPAEANI